MSVLEADAIVDRRRLRRRLGLWRIVAVMAVVIALVALALAGTGDGTGWSGYSSHIARVRIEGLITGDRNTLKLLDKIAKSKRVKAVLVEIDSPGGTTAGSEAIYEALRRISADKPIVAVLGTVAASGGYITAIAADRIVARGNSITGSIGVLVQWAEVRELLNSLGVKINEIKSGELKAEPNFFNPPSEKVREVTEAMVQDSYRWFVGLVAERRGLGLDRATELADGRVYTGRQALAVRLVDEIGGEDAALKWLRDERKISKDLEIIDWKPSSDGGLSDFGVLIGGLLRHIPGMAVFEKIALAEQVSLDGLVSVWHP